MKFFTTLFISIFLLIIHSNAQSHTFSTYNAGTLTSGTSGINTSLNTTGLTDNYMVFIIKADFVGTGNVAWSNTIHTELNNGASTIYKNMDKATTGSADNGNATTLTWTGIMNAEYVGGGTLNIRFFDDYHDGAGPYTCSITNVEVTIYEANVKQDFPSYTVGTLTSGTAGITTAMSTGSVTGNYLLFRLEADFVGTGNVAWSNSIHAGLNNGSSTIYKELDQANVGWADNANATTLVWTGIMNAEYAGGGNLNVYFFDDYHDGAGPYTSSITNVKLTIYEVSTPQQFTTYSPGTLTSGNAGINTSMNVATVPTGNYLLYKIEADFIGTGNPAWSSTIHAEVSNGGALIYKSSGKSNSGFKDNTNATTLVWVGLFNAEYQSGLPINLRIFDDYHDGAGPYSSSITNVKFTLYKDAGVSLPVELLSFTGKNKEATNHLSWITASEENNKGFEIERSMNGTDFKTLGFVEGNGNSVKEIQYTFTDELLEQGIHYYRLKQIDFDGVYEYSKIIQITVNNEGAEWGEIYPNPSGNQIVNIDYFSEQSTDVSIRILDITGKLVQEQTSSIETGNQVLKLDFTYLEKGAYFIQFQTEGETTNRKIIIQ